MIYLKAGNTVSAKDFRPIYLRLSQAERERMASGQELLEPTVDIS